MFEIYIHYVTEIEHICHNFRSLFFCAKLFALNSGWFNVVYVYDVYN